MAHELINLMQLVRIPRALLLVRTPQYQREFEDAFIYEETPGQLKSIKEIKKIWRRNLLWIDFSVPTLVSGKTEAVLRVSFKAILDGKQVAILVPTTILAQQHYNTIKERFKNFPVGVGLLKV